MSRESLHRRRLLLHTPAPEALGTTLEQMRARRQQWARAASYPLFSIEGVLLDASSGTVRLSFLFDLLIADAASLNVLTAELGALYTAPTKTDGLKALGPTPTYTHRDWTHDKLVTAESTEGRAARAREDAFWALRLRTEEDGGLPAAPQLPLLSRPAAAVDAGLSRLWWRLERPTWEALQTRGKLRRLTPTQILLAAYSHTLACWSASRHFTMTLANFGRTVEAEAIVGQLADVMLVEVDLRADQPFAEAAATIVASMLATIEHSVHTSGVDVMRQLNQRDGALGRATSPYVFASVLGATPAAVIGETASQPAPPSHPARLFTWHGTQRPVAGSMALDTPQVVLDHQCFNDLDGALLCNWDFDASRFPPGVAEEMFEAYTGLLRLLATGDSGWDAPAKLVPPSHLHAQLAIQANELSPELLGELTTIHAPLFDETTAPLAAKAAVFGADGQVSFGELRQLSLRYAAAIEVGATRDGPGGAIAISSAPVAVALAKCSAQVVAVLAALASGRAYVPVALNQPADRIEKILLAVDCAVALIGPPEESALAAKHIDLHSFAWPTGCFPLPVTLSGELPESASTGGLGALREAVISNRPSTGEIAYIIFTSGSTGVPKGVAIAHLGACNTCRDINQRFGVGPSDVVLSLAALSFDLSVYDLFGVLATGGQLVMPDPAQGANPEHWLDLLEQHAVTVWNTAPPVMTALLEYVRVDDEAASRFGSLPLRVVMLSGDFCPKWVPTELKERLRRGEGHSREPVAVYTLGGATEASIWSCFYAVERKVQRFESGSPANVCGVCSLSDTTHVSDSRCL